MALASTSTEPTLRKLGSHLRWFIEKCGVDAERVIISIGVKAEQDRSLLISGLLREFDASCMKRNDHHAEFVELHGVKLFVVIPKPRENA